MRVFIDTCCLIALTKESNTRLYDLFRTLGERGACFYVSSLCVSEFEQRGDIRNLDGLGATYLEFDIADAAKASEFRKHMHSIDVKSKSKQKGSESVCNDNGEVSQIESKNDDQRRGDLTTSSSKGEEGQALNKQEEMALCGTLCPLDGTRARKNMDATILAHAEARDMDCVLTCDKNTMYKLAKEFRTSGLMRVELVLYDKNDNDAYTNCLRAIFPSEQLELFDTIK